MKLGLERRVALSYEEAVEKVRATLKEEDFGVLTEIDVKSTLKQKIDADFRRYVILGSCNPGLAHRALGETLQIGLLLPCNVIVYEEGDGAVVSAMNPALMVNVFESDSLKAVAEEATEKLQRAIDNLE